MDKRHVLRIDGDRYEFCHVGKPGTRPLFLLHGYALRPEYYLLNAERMLEDSAVPEVGQVVLPDMRFPKGRHHLLPKSTDGYCSHIERFVRGFMEGEEELGYAIGGHSGGGAFSVLSVARLADLPPSHAVFVNSAIPTESSPLGLFIKGVVGHVEETLTSRSLEEGIGANVVGIEYILRNALQWWRWWSGLGELSRVNWDVDPMDVTAYAVFADKDRIFSYSESDIEGLMGNFTGDGSRSLVVEGRHNLPLRRPYFTNKALTSMVA